ncbi:hypothetical protein [Leptolyngbya ohadii]|uniref:hypothetical protein n=1 Tax=Leptolyngbya ohadii TaxID=1962290 RepID=UPI0019D43001|nr:hypothetical protein [Leptolyngbya ohadii]
MRVLLIVDTLPADPEGWQACSVAAIEQAIRQFPISPELEVAIVSVSAPINPQPQDILCPLTLNLPDSLIWDGQEIYQACRNVDGLRDRVRQKFNLPVATGEFWLPIVLTAKGALYTEAICREGSEYHQPFHLPDLHRQPLYRLAHRLLKDLNATPSVYLLQFGWTEDRQIGFDRLIPFPSEPAIASLKVQTPDLLTCHWQCLTNQPILDIQIPGNVAWRSIHQR